MKYKVILFLFAFATQSQSRSLLPKDLAEDVASALAAVVTTLVDTIQLFETLNSVDDVLMFQIQVLVGNIILKLYSVGVVGSDLTQLQTIINNCEAVTVYQVYLQAYAVLGHRDLLTLTQGHLDNDLTQLASDRDLLATSKADMITGFDTAFELTGIEINKFNTAVNSFIEGMSGPEIDEIRNSLRIVNFILNSTKNDIKREHMTMDASTQVSIDALDVVIAQLPAHISDRLDVIKVVKSIRV